MNRFIKFFHELAHPHCDHCLRELEYQIADKECESCETLRKQLEIANFEKNRLLDRLLEKPEVIENQKPVNITPPKTVPWAVRRQLLEAEDRKKAELLKQAPAPTSVDELEESLDVKEK